jgi:hypothetical protein
LFTLSPLVDHKKIGGRGGGRRSFDPVYPVIDKHTVNVMLSANYLFFPKFIYKVIYIFALNPFSLAQVGFRRY